jgi:CelD/BcsL family acetyltransferase involved in cellulose biosynthesis
MDLVLRTSLVTSADALEALRDPWRELAASSESATPFQTWEWQTAWWKAFGGRKRLHLVLMHEGDDLVGLMPLTRTLAPWRTLRPMGSGPSDYLQPLSRPGYDEAVADALIDHFSSLRDVDLVDLHQVRESQPLARRGVPDATRIEQAVCLVLDLPATYDAYLATLGKSLRYDVRRLDKEPFQGGRAKIRSVGASEAGQGMQVLFEAHRKRWRKRGLPGAFVGRRVQRFHEEWAQAAIPAGYLWLSLLELDDRPVGAIYAMAFGSACYYYQAGFDPEASAISPGTLLVAHTVRRAIEEGKTHFDFMRGDEPYKRRWKPQHELRNYRFIMPAQGILGRLGSSWNRTGSRVEHRVRARLEGRGLL